MGILNVDVERKLVSAYDPTDGNNTSIKKDIYYYPIVAIGSYGSIISSSNINGTYKDFLDNAVTLNPTDNEYIIAKLYYTALGRERYEMARRTQPYKKPIDIFN